MQHHTVAVGVGGVVEPVAGPAGLLVFDQLEPGDQIMSIAGQPISSAITPQDLNAMLEGTEGTTVPVEFERDGEGTRTVELNVDSLALVGAPGRVGISRGLPDDDKVGAAAGLVDAPKEFVNLSITSLQALGKFFTPGGVSDFAGQVVDARDDRAATVQEDQARSAPVTETSTRMVDDGGGNDEANNSWNIGLSEPPFGSTELASAQFLALDATAQARGGRSAGSRSVGALAPGETIRTAFGIDLGQLLQRVGSE